MPAFLKLNKNYNVWKLNLTRKEVKYFKFVHNNAQRETWKIALKFYRFV